MSSLRLSLLLIAGCALLFFSASPAFSQAMMKEREWTNADGKKVRAELLDFVDDSVRFRMANGSVFKVDPRSLIREDQAVLLKARIDHFFRNQFSEKSDAHFFYSKRIPKDGRDGNTVAYIGNDPGEAWLRLKVNADPDIADRGAKVLLIGEAAGPIEIPYDEDDIGGGRQQAIIDLSLSKHRDTVSRIFENPSLARIVIESDQGIYTEVPLSREEKIAIQEVVSTYESLLPLTTDHVWWTTFQGVDIETFRELTRVEPEPDENTPTVMPIPNTDQKPVLPIQTWEIESSGDSFTAAVSGFDRHRVLFLLEDGSTRATSVEELTRVGRESLASARMKHAFYKSWHPIDEDHSWYFPHHWPDPDERTAQALILFAINRETGRPELFLQQCFKNKEAVGINSCTLKAGEVFADIELPVDRGTLKLREKNGTKVWIHLNREICELLLVASPALEKLSSRITPETGSPQSDEFSEHAYEASMEAIEVFRAWHSLLDIKPRDPVDVANPTPEP